MTQEELKKLSPKERANWLHERRAFGHWAEGDDVFCLHCDGVFKAEDVDCDPEGDPTCPVCHTSTPLDFDHLPWWRGDLTKGPNAEAGYVWSVTPIRATPGEPGRLPRADRN